MPLPSRQYLKLGHDELALETSGQPVHPDRSAGLLPVIFVSRLAFTGPAGDAH